MAGRNDNLIPLSERNEEEVKRITSAGGKACGKARRRRKAMKDIALLFGSQDAPASVIAKLIKDGLLEQGETCSMDEALMLAQYSKAIYGSTKAAQFVRDTSGQKPKDEVEISTQNNEKLEDILSQLGGKGLEEEEE